MTLPADIGPPPPLPFIRNDGAVEWTDAWVERMRKLRLAGWSYSQIRAHFAREGLRVSRNALIGKMQRAGGDGLAPSSRQASRKGGRVVVAPAPRLKAPPPPKPPKPPPPEAPAPPPVRRATLAQVEAWGEASAGRADCDTTTAVLGLTAGSCRWPIGDPGRPGFRFCGADAEPGRSYCAEHAAQAVEREAPSVRKRRQAFYEYVAGRERQTNRLMERRGRWSWK